MADQMRFEDGAAHERMMGTWSRLNGEIFLDWLAPPRDCGGLTSAAEMAPLQSCLLSAARQQKSKGSIRPMLSWP